MSLICPNCGSDRFKIIDALEVGPDGYWDERTCQRARCPDCKTRFICIYRERRSFSERRGDEFEHLVFENQSRLWSLASFIFTKPARRKSARWRLYILRKLVLIRCVRNQTARRLEYRRDAPKTPIKAS